METRKLFMILLGCKPNGRLTEQHDIFFGIADELKDLIPQMKKFWPEAKGQLHIDAWREVSSVDGFRIDVVTKTADAETISEKLFFINLGGYKEGQFDEFHYKVLAVGNSLADATKKSKKTAFYKHYDVKGAASHVDDKYGIDIDDSYNVADLLSEDDKQSYSLRITAVDDLSEDFIHIGYFQLSKL